MIILGESCITCSLNIVQDPIQFLADYLMKNNKKEESDKEESEDSKTDV